MISKKTLAAATIVVGLITGATPAFAQPYYSVSQGDKAIVLPPGSNNGSKCTVGYNGNGFSYVSAHCGKDGYAVHLQLPSGYTSPRVGTFHRSPAASVDNGAANFNDWGVIEWDRSVTIGPNRYSGDALIDPDTVTSGDTACVYGDTTRKISCGPFVGNLGKTFFVDNVTTNPGDSGGPMWIPGRGLVGLISGPDMASMQSWNDSWSVNVTRGAHPGINDSGHTADQRIQMFSTWVHNGFVPRATPVVSTTTPEPTLAPTSVSQPAPVEPTREPLQPATTTAIQPQPHPTTVEPTPQPTTEWPTPSTTTRPSDPWTPEPLMTFHPGEDAHLRLTIGPDYDTLGVTRLDPIMDEYVDNSLLKKKKAKAVSEVEPADLSAPSNSVTPAEPPRTTLPSTPGRGYVSRMPDDGRGLTTPEIIGIALGNGDFFGSIWSYIRHIFWR